MAGASLSVFYFSLNRRLSVRNPILGPSPSQGVECARMRNLAMDILDDERSKDAASWRRSGRSTYLGRSLHLMIPSPS